jgi:hypothetical protein
MSKRVVFVLILGSFTNAIFGQNSEAVSLDRAINDSMVYLTGRLDKGTRVAVLNFDAPPAVSSYVLEEAAVFLVNDGKFTVVDRNDLESLQSEMDFQLSGEVSDESAQSIGKKLGAQTIISGSFDQFGDVWRIQIKALEVETARVQGISTHMIKNDSVLDALLPKQPKTIGEKIGTGGLNILFGLGSYLDGDVFGGLTITAGFAIAAGLFVAEAAALDWDSPAVGIPATIGVSLAGLTLVYGFARPFIYNHSSNVAAFLDNMKIEAVPVSGNRNRYYPDIAFRVSYSFNW